jgi:hypothetical protein
MARPVTQNAGVSAKNRWTDQVSLGVLASSVPRDVIDDAVAAAGRQAKRSDGKLPPHVMVYFAMAMALFADEDYEGVRRLAGGHAGLVGVLGCPVGPPTSGGITRARERLGFEPLRDIFARVAVPVADPLTRGAFAEPWRLMSIDGFEWDVPDTPENAAAFGYAGSGTDRSAQRLMPHSQGAAIVWAARSLASQICWPDPAAQEVTPQFALSTTMCQEPRS